MITPKTLFKEIQAGKFKPAYYFFGAEDYRIFEAEKFIASSFLPNRQLTTNYRRIDARQTKCGDLITELSTIPMLGERQVFVIVSFQSYSPKQIASVLSLLTPPDPHRVIIFSSPSSKAPRKKSKFFTTMDKAVVTVEFKRLSPADVAVRIQAHLQKEGLTIDREAVTLLSELVDGNFGAINAEIAKLIEFKGAEKNISVEDIRTLTSGYEIFNIFELADHVVQGNTRKLIKMIRQLNASGHSPVSLGFLMQQHFLSLYFVKNGKPPVGNRAFLIPHFRRQATGYDNTRLEQIIIQLADLDSAFRRSKLKPMIAFEMCVLTLAGEKVSGYGR